RLAARSLVFGVSRRRMILRADLHMHSCLSPCGSLEMSPSAMAARAAELGLDVVALTDHNSALNTPAFAACCAEAGLVALFGLEVTTREEAHVLALFDAPAGALELSEWIYERLPEILNDPEELGDQVYVDAREEILGTVDRVLTAATDVSVDELARRVSGAGGLFVPAHIDRPYFSLPSQLGFLPDLPYDALEITRLPCIIDTGGRPLITSSDAHYLPDIGSGFTELECERRDAAAVLRALRSGAVVSLRPRFG
ncbi:MAG: PHP domain-containing protein, partial [Armatimonadia bacterium]|nr:PHP domain-containing protein [Armatimonadia bacterium]